MAYLIKYTCIIHKRTIARFLVSAFLLLLCICGYSQNESGYKIKTVVIDAGHGGKDPGATCKTGYEKDLTLSIAKKLGHYIDSLIDGVKVIYTREDDSYIELHKRAQIANSNKADIFISIHINSNKSDKPNGFETYVLGLHRSEANLEVAKKENSVILQEDDYDAKYEGFDPNSSEAYIMFSLLQNAHMEQSLSFANTVQTQFRERIKRNDRGVKQAGFLVLWKTTMPSVLIEAGFISNASDAEYLFNETNQYYVASAIFRAFRDYKNQIEGNNVVEKDLPEIKVPEKKVEVVLKDSVIISEIKKDSLSPEKINVPEPKHDTSVVQKTLIKDSVENKNPDPALLYTKKAVFKIQIASSIQKVETIASNFNGIESVEEFYDGISYKYTVGNFSDYPQAIEYQKEIRKTYPDAFMIAFKNGQKIPLTEALNK